jgi:hypothetical protein
VGVFGALGVDRWFHGDGSGLVLPPGAGGRNASQNIIGGFEGRSGSHDSPCYEVNYDEGE